MRCAGMAGTTSSPKFRQSATSGVRDTWGGRAVSTRKWEVIPREVKPLAALIRPDRADARPDFLAGLIFARGPAVVEDICWGVWHRNVS